MWYPLSQDEKNSGQQDETGRGVYNPVKNFDPKNPAHQPRFIPESYEFLSTVPVRSNAASSISVTDKLLKAQTYENPADIYIERDKKSIQLRKEIGQMTIDLVGGKLFPPILTSREEVLGMPWIEYNQKAAKVRALREKKH